MLGHGIAAGVVVEEEVAVSMRVLLVVADIAGVKELEE